MLSSSRYIAMQGEAKEEGKEVDSEPAAKRAKTEPGAHGGEDVKPDGATAGSLVAGDTTAEVQAKEVKPALEQLIWKRLAFLP